MSMESSEAHLLWQVSSNSRKMFEITWKRGECFGSKYFSSKDKTWWNLCLYPLGDTPCKKEVVLRVCRQSIGKKVFIEGEITLTCPRTKGVKFPIRQSLSKTDTYVRLPLFNSLKEMYEYFPPQQALRVLCKICVCAIFNGNSDAACKELESSSESLSSTEVESLQSEYSYITNNDTRTINMCTELQNLSDDMRAMLKNEHFSDVVLCCGKVKLRAHKNILSARSGTFAKMFNPSSLKTTEQVVTVNNVDASVLEEMISYIYTARMTSMNCDIAKRLLLAAEYYAVDELQKVCFDFLVSRLSLDNVVDLLLFAEKQKSKELKKISLEFLSMHFSEIKQTDTWNSLIKEQPGLGVEILSSIVETSNLKTI